ncbi:MAG: hypothetical protein ACAI38_22900 [Myxococcota bacterium]
MPPTAEPATPTAPQFTGLGPHTRKVSTTSAEAQRHFDQGLAFLYAFNHDEARRSFEKASDLDPHLAIAHWGVAMTNGPHINFPMVPEPQAAAARAALDKAKAALTGASPSESALINAADKRYAMPQPADRKPLDQAYADAMREAWRVHADDADVGALFAEALMDVRPWDQWTSDGKPQPGTAEVLATLEAVLAKAPRHPLANHLYIHAIEASPEPAKADAAAEALRDLTPGLGHMLHMPTHIDVRRGRWAAAISSNNKAIEADTRYREQSSQLGFYGVYMAHNRHMLAFAAMMSGQRALALSSIRAMLDTMPPDWKRDNAVFVDGYTGMPIEVLLRFGEWEQVLKEPEPPEVAPIARALRLYGRGVALAALGRVKEAKAEQSAFLAAKAKVPSDAAFGNNGAADLLGVAEHLLAGEILYREGKRDAAFAELRVAVKREDALRYDEPPDWIQPTRHALGAALLDAGRSREAEAVYREDLARLPENVWSLRGLASSLRAQRKTAEADDVETRLSVAGKDADVKPSSSCPCIPGAQR